MKEVTNRYQGSDSSSNRVLPLKALTALLRFVANFVYSRDSLLKGEARERWGVSVIYPLYCLDFGFRLDFEMALSEGGYEDIDFSLHVFNYNGITTIPM